MRINHVLAATDLRSTSEAAHRYASTLARAFGSELHLLHVVPHTSDRQWAVEPGFEPGAFIEEPGAETRLRRLASEVGPARTRAVVRHGRVAEQILEYAAGSHADLIVLGMHGSGRMPPFLGSVAQRVQLGANCPVLLVPGKGHPPHDTASGEPGTEADRSVPRTILVPTDFSQHSCVALTVGRYFGRSLEATVHLLHVIDPPRYVAYVPPVAESTEELRRRARRRVELEVTRHEDGDAIVRPAVRAGDPATEILDAATDLGADLIIMGTHGRPALQRLVLGSVSQKVLRRAPCPILTVCASHTQEVEETSVSSEGTSERQELPKSTLRSQRPGAEMRAAAK